MREFFQQITAGSASVRIAWRAKCLNRNPYLWIAARAKRANLSIWLFLLVLTLAWCLGLWRFGTHDWMVPEICGFTAVALQLSLKITIARSAAERFIEDRSAGAMELLLSTPLSVGEIIRGQWAGLRVYFGGPLVFLFAAEFLLYLASLKWGRAAQMTEWNRLMFCNAFLVVLDVWALVWISMASSLTAVSTHKAASSAIAKIIALPWILFFFVLPLLLSSAAINPSAFALLAIWVGLCGLIDLAFGLKARHLLYTRFRELAMQRFLAPKRRWRDALPKHPADPAA